MSSCKPLVDTGYVAHWPVPFVALCKAETSDSNIDIPFVTVVSALAHLKLNPIRNNYVGA
jgi:hypothetical protein